MSAPPLTYEGLRALIERTRATLNDLGIGLGDRVAIVLPNGPEMATAFLCVASAATSAPLNPAYKQDEFEFYLEDLKAKALIVEAGSDSPALRAAEKLGVALLTLIPERQVGAGAFELSGSSALAPPSDPVRPNRMTWRSCFTPRAPPRGRRSCRFTMPTSGPRPAISRASLELSADDRALNVMPLFHIHGLIAGFSLRCRAAAPVFCTPGFNALKFFAGIEEASPPGTPPCRPCIRRS